MEATAMWPNYNNNDERADAEMSKQALERAISYEQKLLRAGHREILSPLMVKRRLKPKIELKTSRTNKHFAKQHPAAAATTHSFDRLLGGVVATNRFGFSGIVENKTMKNMSESIVQHGQKDHLVPCGLPTCLAFNSKFIAVGTQSGIMYVCASQLFSCSTTPT
jgi:hypothetical protein